MKKLKTMIIGIVIGLLIGTAGTALAASESVQATFQKFNFKVNGEELQLEADPLVYQGTTYLPVRVVANMLGYDVTYKADSRTIELTNYPAFSASTISENKKTILEDDIMQTVVSYKVGDEIQLPQMTARVKGIEYVDSYGDQKPLSDNEQIAVIKFDAFITVESPFADYWPANVLIYSVTTDDGEVLASTKVLALTEKGMIFPNKHIEAEFLISIPIEKRIASFYITDQSGDSYAEVITQ